MTPGLRAKIFNIIDWLVENEAVGYTICGGCGEEIDDGADINIPADKIDEVVEQIIKIVIKELDRDKEENLTP